MKWSYQNHDLITEIFNSRILELRLMCNITPTHNCHGYLCTDLSAYGKGRWFQFQTAG